MRLLRWIGHNGTSAVIAEQFGTAMMPLCSAMRPALISGITRGTFGSIRKADELSMTTAPAFAAIGENRLEMLLPAENSAMLTPSNERSLSSSTTIRCPRKSSVLPAERALASAFRVRTGNRRLSSVAMNWAPTAPVTPAIATTGSFFTSLYPLCLSMTLSENRYPLFRIMLQAIKKPRTFSGGASGSDDAIVRLRAHASRGPAGLSGFRGAFGVRHHGAALCGRF